MLDKKRKISTLIESQLPGFIASEYGNFTKFLSAYYEQLEFQGQPLDVINNLESYLDISTYDNNALTRSDVLSSSISATDTTITLQDASSFPKEFGYVRIDNEICFYKKRNGNRLENVTRGVSGNLTLGDLYEESEFVSTDASSHSIQTPVYNVSNLFLYALVKSFESQYLAGFPEKFLLDAVDKRTLIKYIGDFYKTKGNSKSINFLFSTILTKSGEKDFYGTYNPKDYTIKASTSQWSRTYSLRVKSFAGNPLNLVGKRIEQVNGSKSVFATVDNVVFIDKIGNESIYDIILAEETVTGLFDVASRTALLQNLSSSATVGDLLIVHSTQGWNSKQGRIYINNELIAFRKKTATSFTIDQRSSSIGYNAGTPVYSDTFIQSGDVKCIVLGVAPQITVSEGAPYSSSGEKIEIIDASIGNERDPKRNVWLGTSFEGGTGSYINSSAFGNEHGFVQALYENDDFYYVCCDAPAESGEITDPANGFTQAEINAYNPRQNHLKLIRKTPITTTEVYSSGERDIGLSEIGIPYMSAKDTQYLENGDLTSITVTNRGKNYKNPPYVLINNRPGIATAIMSGEVVSSIRIDVPGSYKKNPDVTITSGRKATAEATVTNGKVTQIKIIQPGEYYSTAPTVRIIDGAGRGRFAEYTAEVDTSGRITGFTVVSEGNFYSQENIQVEIVPIGENAVATAQIRKWYFDRYKKVENEINTGTRGYFYSSLGTDGGRNILEENIDSTYGLGVVNLLNNGSLGLTHGRILGYAYDGNPIYSVGGYGDPLNSVSPLEALQSGYKLKTSRNNGPSTSTYPLGTFVEDYYYEYSDAYGKTTLDENNGRWCVTPEYPNGTYAYFHTPLTYPYVVGPTFYSNPVASNYTSNIKQSDLPKSVKRLSLSTKFNSGKNIPSSVLSFTKNGEKSQSIIDSVVSGTISDCVVTSSPETFSVGGYVAVDDQGTGGSGATASVGSIKGKTVTAIESREKKAVKIQLTTSAYLFAGDTLTQDNTNANGTILGDVINGNEVILTDVSGDFNNDDLYTSSTQVVSLLLNQDSSYTEGASISLTDGDGAPLGVGVVLDTTIRQNVVRLRVESGSFFITEWESELVVENGQYITYDGNVYEVSTPSLDEPTLGTVAPTHRFGSIANGQVSLVFIARNVYLQSDKLIDTVATSIITTTSLSSGLVPFSINENIAVVKTQEDHGLSIGDFVEVDINPFDADTNTEYFVRRRILQECVLQEQNFSALLKNSGIGRLDILNAGNDYVENVYNGIELVFLDSDQARPGIGIGGDPANATATVVVNANGQVESVTIENPGYGYAKGDILTIPSASLGRSSIGVIPVVILQVDHAGFARESTSMTLSDVTQLSNDDLLKINNEIVKISSVDAVTKVVVVERAQEGTTAADHYFNQDVDLYNSNYEFFQGQLLGSNVIQDPVVLSYDEATKKLTVGYNYVSSLTTINQITLTSAISDASTPAKRVLISSVEEPANQLQFAEQSQATSDYNFVVNPVLELQNNYKYTFNYSHTSMNGYFFDVSPSKNQNLITLEKGSDLNRTLFVKFGYGPNSLRNNFDEKEDLKYLNYFYYANGNSNAPAGSGDGYLKIISDPLQGQKQVDYVSNDSFVYLLNSLPQYDGSGEMTYTTTSFGTIGEIASINVTNFGSGYLKLPKFVGAVPTTNNESTVRPIFNENSNTIERVEIVSNGQEYRNPKVVVTSGGGFGAEFQVLTNNRKVVRVIVLDGGSGYTTEPTLRVVESDISAYFTSDDIGVPRNVKVLDPGFGFHNDNTLLPYYRSNYVLKVSGSPTFYEGELVYQIEEGSSTASAYATIVEWVPGPNLLKIKNQVGIFNDVDQIYGATTKNNRYDIVDIFYTDFNPTIKNYYDNLGSFQSDTGRLNVGTQKLTDSYFYQDYSYVVKSKKSINDYRDLIKGTTHPAGFQLFGEMMIDSEGKNRIPEDGGSHKTVKIITLYDENANLVTTSVVKERASQSISNVSVLSTVEERGIGSIQVDDFNLTETVSNTIVLNQNFNGRLKGKTGQKTGTTSFDLIDEESGLPFTPYNDVQLIVTLDGVIQEPGVSYTISNSTITFTEPPLGPLDEVRTFEDGSKIIEWTANVSVNAGDFVWYTNGIVYLALNSGTLGNTAPTHTTQSVQNGTVNLEYSGLTKTPGQSFYCKAFKFKDESLNSRYLKKFANIYQRNGRWLDAANQIERNRTFIQEETLGYVKSRYPNVNWNTFEQKCYRDIGYIIDGYAKDLRFGGNSYTINNGKLYYDGTVLDHIENELTETLAAFEYASRLCKLAMRNWDYVYDEVTYFQGSDIMVVDDTSSVAVGMYVSAGDSYPDGTFVSEIVSDTELRLSNPATGAAGSELISTDTDITQNTTTNTNTVGVSATLRVLSPYFYRVLQGGSNQATFYWSGVNSGTYYDAANLILANEENIKKEASFAITDGFQLFQYPDQPLEASIFKDARRLIYKNKDFLADYVLERIDAQYPGFNYGGLVDGRQTCRRDILYIIDALATDLGRDSNENMVNATKHYFDENNELINNGLVGELEEGIYGYQQLIGICQQVITNQGAPGGALDGFSTLTGRSAYYDLNIIADEVSGNNTDATNCSDVRSAIDTLINILIVPLDDARQGNPVTITSPTTGNTTWYKQEDKCKRDIGYLVKDVAYHLKFGGNRKIVEFGKFYYEGTNKVAFVNNELQETVYAFNAARDLMILAMRNDISGDTIITPVIDPLIAPDAGSPECAEVASSISSFAQIVEDTLTVGRDLYVVTPENENYSGYYSTNTKSYSNYNLIDDPQLVASECDDVSSAIALLYEALDTTLSVGKDAALLSGADYFDGVTKEFELYFEDGTPADLDENERLLVTLSGVLQTSKHAPNLPLGDAYYIDRTSVPNKIVFSEPPIWDQNDNVKEVQEPLAVEKFAARTIGSYERLGIDTNAITGKTGGPFIMKSLKDGKVKSIENPKYSLVFIDGVLQRSESYVISGPAITFAEPLNRSDTGQYAKVDILLYYGKDSDQTVTVFDHEQNTYYHKIQLDIQGAGTFTTFDNWNKGYADITVYQYDPNTARNNILGIVRKIESTDANNWRLVLSSGETPKYNASLDLQFQPNRTLASPTSLTISGTFTFAYTLDTDGDRRMQRDVSKWMYDSGLTDTSWAVKNRLMANILPGDTIKVDGEDEFRKVVNIPPYVKSRNHLPGSQAWNQYYGTLDVTNYDGIRRGEGLSVTTEIDTNTGQVTKLNWDDNSLELYFNSNLLENPTAYQYFWTPVLNFVSIDGTGGGAEAAVIVSKGQIVDVTLLNPGSGYTKPPLVKVSRGFARIKNNRKIDSFTTLGFENKVDQGMSQFTTSYVTVIPPRLIPGVTTTVDVRPAIGFDPDADPVRKITNIVTPDPEEIESGLDDSFVNIPQPRTLVLSVDDVNVSSSSSVTTRIASITQLEVTGTSEIFESIEMFDRVNTGMVDTGTTDYELDYDGGVLGNRASRFETTKFVGGGVITNGISFEELERWFPNMTLADWADPTLDGTSYIQGTIWNFGYSTETQYMTYVDTTALPGVGDPGYLATNAVVYVGSTASFPASGTVIVGREKITYTAKLSDRFTGVTRGAEGTEAEAHPLLELVRTIDP